MKRTKHVTSILAAALSVIVLFGCSTTNTTDKAKPTTNVSSAPSASATSSAATTIKDFAGTAFSTDKPVKTVMAIHPIFTMLALRLAPEKVVSVDKIYTQQYLSEKEKLPLLKNLSPEHIKALPVTNTFMQVVDPEQVLNLNPDVVVTLDKDANAAKLKAATKKPFVIVSKNTLQNYSTSIRVMGVVLGNTKEANQMADYWDQNITSISTKTDAIAQKDRPNVYHTASGSILATVGKDTIMASVVRIAGGNNLGDTISNTSNSSNESITVSMDQILKWNPDVIVANTAGQYKEIMSSPDWKSVSAVKNGKVYCQLKFAQIDGLTTLPGLLWYNAILSSQNGTVNLDSFDKEAPNFFKLFFKYDITPNELQITR